MSPKKSATTKVTVPASAGEQIVLRIASADPVTYDVSGGTVTVDDADLPQFLAIVEGSTVAGGSPAAESKE